jgi:tetratricopeptide (TPR) repeat protein
VDQATVDLRRDLGVPEWHLAETPDLPVADITSRDPEAFRDFMRAVRALMLRNDYGEAERHGLAAVERDPRFGLAWFQLMQVYANGGQGRYEEAWERYERVVLLEPDNTDARLRLADLRDRQGRFDGAIALLDEAEREAVTVVDRAAVLANREALLRDLGRLREAIAAHERANALRSQYIPPVSVAFGDIELMALHIHLGDTATGLDVWRARRPLLSNLYADANGFYRCIYGVLIEDPDTLARGLDQVRRFSDAFGADPRFLEQMNAELLRLQGRPAEAAERYGAFLDSRRGQVLRGRVDLAELHRRAGALDRARTIIDEVLEQQPRYSFGLLEAAEIALANGRQADARRHLEALMEVWAGADAAYGEARRATALLAGLANG